MKCRNIPSSTREFDEFNEFNEFDRFITLLFLSKDDATIIGTCDTADPTPNIHKIYINIHRKIQFQYIYKSHVIDVIRRMVRLSAPVFL